MADDYLILTNHTRRLNIGKAYENSSDRYNEAKAFLAGNHGEMNLHKLIDLNRGNEIRWMKYPEVTNLHSAIFRANTLDFWAVAGPSPATRGKWVGFNLKIEPSAGETLILDMLIVTPEIKEAWDSRMTVEWEYGNISVVSPEGLILLKSLRRSGQDQDDIDFLRSIINED